MRPAGLICEAFGLAIEKHTLRPFGVAAYAPQSPYCPSSVGCASPLAGAAAGVAAGAAAGLGAGLGAGLAGAGAGAGAGACANAAEESPRPAIVRTDIARLAFKALLEEISGIKTKTNLEYKTRFVLRESTCAPKN